ncbi:MAG: CobW family GTP-binding protein [Planctomycetota bacterium]|jgi:G3E family GTPase
MTDPTRALQTPVTLLSGWLGAGKTTLLNRLLQNDRGTRYAVLVNEFGEIGIDDRLVVRSQDDLVELSNGCVCCTVRGDLVESLKRIRRKRFPWSRRPSFDRILIETTGIAEPAPLLRTFLVEDEIATYYRVQSVVTLVDAAHLEAALAHRTAIEQIALADLLVLNKADLVAPEALAMRQAELQDINPTADVHTAAHADLPLHAILEANRRELPQMPEAFGETQGHGDIRSVSLVSDVPLDELKTRLWLDACVQQLGEELIRYKGFLHIEGLPYRCVLQGVYDLYSVEAHGEWDEAHTPRTEVVFIGHDLERAFFERGLNAALSEGARSSPDPAPAAGAHPPHNEEGRPKGTGPH